MDSNFLAQSLHSGPVVFSVLLILVGLSITSWGLGLAKIFYLKKINKANELFIKKFWDSRSLNELNQKLPDFPYSPARESFRHAYNELVKGTQLKDQAISGEMAVKAILENIHRTLQKAKSSERRNLESFLSFLAITASVGPFIGLFGTVWGIMSAFQGIAQSGTSSLASVAPGISEALIATAFGLGAAIPAVVAYNIATGKIRLMFSQLDGFGLDFLNIVQRYLLSSSASSSSQSSQSSQGF